MTKQFIRRLSSLLMTAVLLLGLSTPASLAVQEPQVIHIANRDDWEEFARNSRLDTWSQDKVVFLDTDLDLMDSSVVPTFGGTFDGQGHTLSGVTITAEGSHMGLFRYNQESGIIRDLHVKGRVVPKGNSDTVGGIIGVNSGLVENCTFEGFLSGGSAVGGIAGFNGATGQITGCSNRSGVVSGEHSTGGIAGVSYGTISRCTNAAQINTQEADVAPQINKSDWGNLNSTENMPACTDTGGVVGYSSGVLRDCSNSAQVGYPHTGYNVGGVAGRQAGYMFGCTNSGLIQGRKEVGGIVGQMEPYTTLHYEEDTLQKLSRELDVLNRRMRGVLDSMDHTRIQLSDHLSAMTEQTQSAKDSVKMMLDEIEAVGEGTVDTANELSRRVDRMLDQLVPVSDEMERAADSLTDAIDELESALSEAERADPSISAALSSFQSAFGQMQSAVDTLHRDLPDLSGHSSLQSIAQWIDQMTQNLNAANPLLSSAFHDLEQAFGSLDRIRKPIRSSIEEVRSALTELSGGSDHVSRSLDSLTQAIQEQSELPELELPKLSPEFHEKGNDLNDTLTALTDRMEQLNQTANQGGDAMSAKLRQVSNQFSVINRILREDRDSSAEEDELVVDASEEEVADLIQGKVEHCQNTGLVEGDLNVGGISGSMAIEYDFDPEDDISNQGSPSFNYRFITRVALQHCVNQGAVTARKDSVGGLTGHMDLGVLLDSENYGPVESVSGSYVGGAVGSSQGLVRDCWVKCTLTGARRVGGIAGRCQNIKGCHSMVEIKEGISFLGAICGEAEIDSILEDNTFLSEELGGVDGVSYAHRAAPLSYEEFVAQPGTPEPFRNVIITFMAGDHLVEEVLLPFGGNLAFTSIPAVPTQSGYVGRWPDFNRKNIRFDQVVEAIYSSILTALSSEDGTILVEGSFSPQAILTVTENQAAPPAEANKLVVPPTHISATEPFIALRVAIPEDCRHAALMVLDQNGQWIKAETTQEGSYLRTTLAGNSADFCMVRVPSAALLWAIPLVLLAAGIALAVGYRMHKRKANRQPSSEEKN